MKPEDRIPPIIYAIVKEGERTGQSPESIAEELEIELELVKEMLGTRYYKDYMKIQDEKIIITMLAEEV